MRKIKTLSMFIDLKKKINLHFKQCSWNLADTISS